MKRIGEVNRSAQLVTASRTDSLMTHTLQYKSVTYAASYAILNYAQAFLGLFVSFLLSSRLGLLKFGDYRVAVVCMGLVGVLGMFGADKGLINDLSQKTDEGGTLANYTFIRVVCSLCIAAVLVIWALYNYGNHDLAWFIIIFTLAGVLVALSPEGWFDHEGRLLLHAKFVLTERFFFAFGVVLFVIFSHDHELLILAAIVLLSKSVLAYAEWSFVNKKRALRDLTATLSVAKVKDILSRYHWLWCVAIANSLMTNISTLVLSSRAGIGEVALFEMASQFTMLVQMFQNQTIRLLAPSIAHSTSGGFDIRKAKSEFLSMIMRAVLSGVILSVVVAIIGSWGIDHLFPPEFVPSKDVLYVLLLWTNLLGVGLVANRFLIGLARQKTAFHLALFGGGLAIILNFFLSPYFGALGAAYILLFCHGLSIAGQIITVMTTLR